MVYSAKSDSTTISQFTRIKYIYVTTNGSSTPANYQVKLIIDYEPEMQADFSDIRFNTLGNIYIDYWIESKTDSVTATVWVELPDAITDPGSDTIWMYYGNSGLNDGGIGSDTFLQYMGVVSSTTLGALNITAPYVYEGYGRQTSGSAHNVLFGVTNTNNASDDGTYMQTHYNNNLRYIYARNDGVATTKSETPDFGVDAYHRLKIINTGSAVTGFVGGDQIGTGDITTNLPNESMGLLFFVATGTGDMKWSFARKYITNEPTPSYGTAQHQRRTPQFIN